jgi:hypothetical protein
MKRYLLIFFFQLINCTNTYAQFNFLNSSRFSRAIGMGNSYTGVAEGAETTFYNSSGLTFIDYYAIAYSYGIGYQYLLETIPFDIAIVIPFSPKVGTLALSSHHLYLDDDKFMDSNNLSSIYRLHYSRLILPSLSVGTSLDYYYHKYEDVLGAQKSDNAFDMSVSILYKIRQLLLPSYNEQFKIGLQFNNLIFSRLSDHLSKGPGGIMQVCRIGISYVLTPDLQKIYGLIPITFLFATDFVFDNHIESIKYKFDSLSPNFGFELKFLELISIRYGRENEINLSDTHYTTPQHPVSRYGIGVSIPLDKIISMKNRIPVLLDYSYSNWDHQDEIDTLKKSIFRGSKGSDKYSCSIQLQIVL